VGYQIGSYTAELGIAMENDLDFFCKNSKAHSTGPVYSSRAIRDPGPRGPGYLLRLKATICTRTVHANLGPWVPGPWVPGPQIPGPRVH